MKRLNFILLSVVFIQFLSASLYSSEALAYLDPGSGSFLLQLLFGLLVGASFFFKSIWQRILNFFSPSRKNSETDSTQAEDTHTS